MYWPATVTMPVSASTAAQEETMPFVTTTAHVTNPSKRYTVSVNRCGELIETLMRSETVDRINMITRPDILEPLIIKIPNPLIIKEYICSGVSRVIPVRRPKKGINNTYPEPPPPGPGNLLLRDSGIYIQA
jgi:hypothetical protein